VLFRVPANSPRRGNRSAYRGPSNALAVPHDLMTHFINDAYPPFPHKRIDSPEVCSERFDAQIKQALREARRREQRMGTASDKRCRSGGDA
jgi:hypothetical protein